MSDSAALERAQRVLAAMSVALAKRILRDWNNDDGRWPKRMEWTDLAGSSHGTLLEAACREAGIEPDTLKAIFRDHLIDIDWDHPAPLPVPQEPPTQENQP